MSDPDISNISDIPGVPESADGTLVIIVCRAKHLPNRRKLDKQSPYVTLRIGTTAKKTPSHFRAGQTPEWTHEIRFELTKDRKPIMKLDVLDETKNDPTPIGTIDIDCSMIFANSDNEKDGKYIFDKWHDLTLNGRRAGMIYLEMTFYPSAPILPPKLADPIYGDHSMDTYHHSPSPNKSLPPPPPKHPSQSHLRTAADDVFVNSDSEKGLKRLSFFKNSEGLLGGHFSNSNESGSDDVLTNEPNGSLPRKYKLKIMNRFKKFQAKEPIVNLWQNGNGLESPERVTSPISEYRIEEFNEHANDSKRDYYKLSEIPDKFKESDDEDFELRPPIPPIPPIPPPHLVNQQQGSDILPPTPPNFKKQQSKSPTRKPPQDLNNVKPVSNTSIPFSADTIGIDDGDNRDSVLPTKVYMLDKQIKSLTFTGREDDLQKHETNPDEIDPKYYAPTPNEHLARTNQPRFSASDSKQTGYLGDGKWNRDPKFSPSVFDRIPVVGDENSGFVNKPHVPPKIPKGLTEQEYYVLEKEKYLKDINGRRL